MHRTQLYLDNDLWESLRARARQERTTISHLVRQAAREHYLGDVRTRTEAMESLVGLRSDRTDLTDATAYVRRLRRGSRIKRLAKR
jgi:predicted DNA-binding ribbon-helix-helix protein